MSRSVEEDFAAIRETKKTEEEEEEKFQVSFISFLPSIHLCTVGSHLY